MASHEVQLDVLIQRLIDTNVANTLVLKGLYTAFRSGAGGAPVDGNKAGILREVVAKTGSQMTKTLNHEEQLQTAARESFFPGA